jgi:hypothetical protein
MLNFRIWKMNPRVTTVEPGKEYTLLLTFQNNEKKVFDVKPYLNTGQFKQLTDLSSFNSVHPFLGSIQWQNGLDLCPDLLYEESKTLKQ